MRSCGSRLLLLAAIPAILASCSAPPPPLRLGTWAEHAPRDRPSLPPAPTATAVDPQPDPWILARELPRLRRVTERGPSEHLAGDLDCEVLVNDAARPYPALGPKHAIPPGATLLERHLRRGSAEVTVHFAMVKRPPGYDPAGGDWEYLVITPDGAIEQRGKLALCARCHTDAPHDHLFGGGR